MLNKHNLSVSECVSPYESRFTLNAILVTPKETAATDGHVLIRVATLGELDPAVGSDEKPTVPAEKYLMPTDVAKRVIKEIPKKIIAPMAQLPKLTEPAVELTEGTNDGLVRYQVGVGDLSLKVEHPTKWQFPDIDRVMPKRDDAAFAISMTTRIFADLLDTIAKMQKGSNGKPEVTLYFRDAERAVLIEGKTDEGQDITAVIMPNSGTRDVKNPEYDGRFSSREYIGKADAFNLARVKRLKDEHAVALVEAENRGYERGRREAEMVKDYNSALINERDALKARIAELEAATPKPEAKRKRVSRTEVAA